MTSTLRLAPAEFDRLEALLAEERFPDAMGLDALQGLFCAVASAPAPIPQEKWLASALGGPLSAASGEATEITDLLARFCSDTARAVASEEGLDVISYPVEEGEEELAGWCEGYLAGVALAEPGWYDAGDAETVAELLFPFLALSGRLEEHAREAGEARVEGEAEAKLRARARDGFYDALEQAYHYWFDARINRVPQRRESVKAGRNEPCPCGSGRKFKVCHGRH